MYALGELNGLRNLEGLVTSNNDLNSRRNRLKRMYAGAVDRTNLSWITPLSSPDQSYKNSIETLRKRVHDLVRNNYQHRRLDMQLIK